MTKVKLENIRPVRNMFKRYGCPTESIDHVESEYIEGEGQRRLWVRFTDSNDAHEAFDLLYNPEGDLHVEVNWGVMIKGTKFHEIVISKPNHHDNN